MPGEDGLREGAGRNVLDGQACGGPPGISPYRPCGPGRKAVGNLAPGSICPGFGGCRGRFAVRAVPVCQAQCRLKAAGIPDKMVGIALD